MRRLLPVVYVLHATGVRTSTHLSDSSAAFRPMFDRFPLSRTPRLAMLVSAVGVQGGHGDEATNETGRMGITRIYR